MRLVAGPALGQLAAHSGGDGEGVPYAPDQEPRRSLSGMLAVAEGEARSSPKLRTGVFMKSLARQIATETSPGFRMVVVALPMF